MAGCRGSVLETVPLLAHLIWHRPLTKLLQFYPLNFFSGFLRSSFLLVLSLTLRLQIVPIELVQSG